MVAQVDPIGARGSGARERIVTTAYGLFTRRGIRDVGVDEVIRRAGVAKATLYKHFPSKTDLVLAVLDRREQCWTLEFVARGSHERAGTPEGRLLAVFDLFDEWFHDQSDFEACSFINVLLEMGADHPVGQACIGYLDNIRAMVRERAEAAGLADPDGFARSWHILMKGSIISAAEGDRHAAGRAKAMGRELIRRYRRPHSALTVDGERADMPHGGDHR
jgi:AcrR family transcriptional regulator